MKSYMLLGIPLLLISTSGVPAAAPCDSADPAFVCGVSNTEDLVRLGTTPWIVANHFNLDVTSGYPPTRYGFGPLQAIRFDTHEVRTLYPTPESAVDWDRKTYPECAAPPQMLSSHGLGVRRLGKNHFRLYVVNHGGRHSVEIIDVAVEGERLHSTWRGCAVVAVEELGVWPNAVAPLPDEGFIVSGHNVATWRPGRGWARFPGFDGATPTLGAPMASALAHRSASGSAANGVAVSLDGKWVFIADQKGKAVIRFPVGGGEQTIIKLPVGPDNLRWGEDGRLYAAAPIMPKVWKNFADDFTKCFLQPLCVTGIYVAAIDPKTLAVEEVMRNEDGLNGTYGLTATALQVGDRLWLTSERAPYLAIVPLRP